MEQCGVSLLESGIKKQIGPEGQTSCLHSHHLINMILLFIDGLCFLFANSLLPATLQTRALARVDRALWSWHMGKKKHSRKSNLKSLLGVYRNLQSSSLSYSRASTLSHFHFPRGTMGLERGSATNGAASASEIGRQMTVATSSDLPDEGSAHLKKNTWAEKRCLLPHGLIEGKRNV